MNRLTQEQRTLTGVTGTFTTGYAYNIKGDLTQMTYPSGRVANFNYATGGGCCNSRLDSVQDQTANTTVTNGLTYNAAGETLTRTLNAGPNAVAEAFTYNTRLQLTGITATRSGTTLMNFAYGYGSSAQNTGRVLSRTDMIEPEHSANYTYDSIYRLSQVIAADVSTSWGISWAFDVSGNRLTQTPQGLSAGKVGTQNSAYTSSRTNGMTYDAAGNQTNDGLHNYAFNAENQITQMDGGAVVYSYDGEGRRMKKTVGSETTYFFYGSGGLISEFSTTTGPTQAAATDKPNYRTSDKLGTAVLIIAASGTVIENNRTLPYGELWTSQVNSANNEKFTTYQRDQESGLDYAVNRYYANTAGRFQSSDKGGARSYVPLTLNRYLYAGNDPVNFTDGTGNEREGRPEPPYPPPPGCSWSGGIGAAAGEWTLSCSRGGPWAGYDVDPLEEAYAAEEQAAAAEDRRRMDLLSDGLAAARKALDDPDCAGLFGRPTILGTLTMTAAGALGQLERANAFQFTVAEGFPFLAVTSGDPLDAAGVRLSWSGIKITMRASLVDDPRELLHTVLHELGHALRKVGWRGGDFIDDDGPNDPPENQRHNNTKITEDCLK